MLADWCEFEMKYKAKYDNEKYTFDSIEGRVDWILGLLFQRFGTVFIIFDFKFLELFFLFLIYFNF